MKPIFRSLLLPFHLLLLFVVCVLPHSMLLPRSLQRASISSSRTISAVYRYKGLVTMHRKEWSHPLYHQGKGRFPPASLSTMLNYSPQRTTSASIMPHFSSSMEMDADTINNHYEQTVNLQGINAKTATPIDHRFKAVPINLYVDSDVRSHLKMRNSDRKARVFLTKDARVDISSLKGLIEKQFAALSQQPYLIRYRLPGVMPQPRPLNSEDDINLITKEITNAGSLQLYIEGKPGVFPPPTEPYLSNMEDPAESTHYTMASFYKFYKIEDPQAFSEQLFQLWRPFKALGRVYVAKEGINAQCAIPSNVLARFKQASETLDMFSSGMYLNVDHELTRSEYEANPAFKNLHVRVRSQIVADGFDKPLDWDKAGREISPKDWHGELDNPDAIVLDCRNSYESEIGAFQNAIPLNTTFFRESWDALKDVLHDKPKDAPIMTYCTGGIRCVKINAFLEQEMGFTNVGRLEGGIISYTKELEKNGIDGLTGEATDCSKPIHLSRDVGEVSKFKGMNYVFDERMGARITADILAQCETCGAHCDLFRNCENYDCHIRFIQCERCIQEYKGCCCVACEKKYSEQLEVKNIFLVEENERRQAKLQRDREFIPVPRNAAKRVALAASGVTKKQMLEADLRSASKVIELLPENEYHSNTFENGHDSDKQHDDLGTTIHISDKTQAQDVAVMSRISEKITVLESSINDLKKVVSTDHQAAASLEKQILELKEQSIQALEERLVSKTHQMLTEISMKENIQLKELERSVQEYHDAGQRAVDKLAIIQTTSIGENENLRMELDAKDIEIRSLMDTISDLEKTQSSTNEAIASFEEKELSIRKENDEKLQAKDKEMNRIVESVNELKLQQIKKDDEISQLHCSVESLKSSLALEQAKAVTAEEEKKNLEDEANDFKDHAHSLDERLGALSTYTERYSSEEPTLLYSLRMDTIDAYGANAARMVSGHLQGRILKLIASMTNAQRILELGTFTGYASLCLAEGMNVHQYDIPEPKLITCEPDAKAINIARKFFEQSPYGSWIDSREMSAESLMESLQENKEKFDIVFIDADKRAYKEYLATVLGITNSIDAEELEVDPERSLLADGGIVVIDNTLWKGLVMHHEEDLRQFSPAPEEFGKAARMEKLAGEMHDFNAFARRLSKPGGLINANEKRKKDNFDSSNGGSDDGNNMKFPLSSELIMLPLRDGLTILQLNGLLRSNGLKKELDSINYDQGDKNWKIQF